MEMYINWLKISFSFLVLSKKKWRGGVYIRAYLLSATSSDWRQLIPRTSPGHVLCRKPADWISPTLPQSMTSPFQIAVPSPEPRHRKWGWISPSFLWRQERQQPCGEALNTCLSNAFSGFRTNSPNRSRKIFKLKRIEWEPWLIKTCPLGKGFQTAMFSKMCGGVAGCVFLFGLDFDCSLYQPFGCSNSWKVMVATVRLEGRTADCYIRSSHKRN